MLVVRGAQTDMRWLKVGDQLSASACQFGRRERLA